MSLQKELATTITGAPEDTTVTFAATWAGCNDKYLLISASEEWLASVKGPSFQQ